MQVRKNNFEQPFSTLQRSTGARSTLDVLLQELSKIVPGDIRLTYDEAAKNITFTFDQCLLNDFVATILNFVYGRKAITAKAPTNLKTIQTSVSTAMCTEDAHCYNVSAMFIFGIALTIFLLSQVITIL